MTDAADDAVGQVFRQEYGRCVATLTRVLGDLSLAEEAVQDAFTAAVERWPADGVPPNPGGWIVVTARRRAVDRLRREASAMTSTPRPRCCTSATSRSRWGR